MIRKSLLLKTMLLLCAMAMGIGSAWGTTTYKLTKVSKVEAGGLYVFEQKGHVMNNTVSSSALQTTTSYSTTGLSGTEKYVWKLEAAKDGGFYLKNVSRTSDQYLNNAGSSTNVSFGDKSSIWTFAFTDDVVLISNKSNSNRFLGYTSSTSYAYRAYAESNLSSSNNYPHAITVYKLEEEANMTDSDLALADAPVELSFDLYNNSSAQVISYTTSSTGVVTVSSSDYITTVVNESAKTITVTPTAVTPSAQTLTVSQAADDSYRAGKVTFTVTIDDSTPIPTHTAAFSVNGTTTTQNFEEGAAIAFPENPADIEGKTFVGWTESAITGVTDQAPTLITSATMGTEALTYYAVFADKTPGTQTTVTDNLSKETLGQIGKTNYYEEFSGKSITNGSDAVYAGCCILVDFIQINTKKSDSGIISTTSGGTLKSVTVTWSEGNTSGRILDVYGSNTAYSKATDLYDSKKQGTKLGSITYDTSTSLTITGDYAYVGLRSNDGALYFTDISIEWTAGTPDTYSAYCTTVAADNRQEAGISFAEATITKEIIDNYTGQTLNNPNNVSPITWTSSNETVATVEDGTVTVLAVGETTIKASFAGDDNYKKAEVSYTLTVQDSRQAIELSFAETSVNVNITETVAAPTLNGNTGNGTVTYESSNTDIATVDASGVVTGVAVGQATITATVAATNEYQDGTATFTVKVVDPNANDGSSIEKAYTVAEAIDVIKALPDEIATTEEYYIKGIVSSFQKTSIVGDGSYYRYFISDDGTTTTELQVFKGKGLNEATFENADDLLVGDEVVIYGPIQYYQGKTPEIAEGNYLVSWNRPVDTTPSITVDPDLVDVDADEHDGTLALAYANLTISGMSNFKVQYYNAEGEEADEPDWIEVLVAEQDPSDGEGYVVSYYMIENEGEERTAYFKVYALDDETNFVYSNLVTVTQAEYVAPEETIGNFVKVTSTDDITSGQYLIVYEDGNVAFDGNLTELDVAENTIPVTIENGNIAATATNIMSVFNIDVTAGTLQSASGLYIGVARNSNELKTSEDAETFTNTFSINDQENAVIAAVFGESTMSLRYNKASDQARFRYYKNAGQKPIQLYKFIVGTVTVTSAGWATYIAEDNVSFGNDVSAYIATGNSDNSVRLTQVHAAPAGTPVVVCAEEGTHQLGAIEASACDDVASNKFEICDGNDHPSGYNYFVLAKNGSDDACFKQWTGKLSDLTGRVVLPLALDLTQHDARSLSIVFDGEATGVKELKDSRIEELKSVYNLNGQRVSQPKKGLYIIDGKKVFKN